MRHSMLIAFLLLAGATLAQTSNAQDHLTKKEKSKAVGTYNRLVGYKSAHNIIYTMQLYENGNFDFHSFSNQPNANPPMVNTYGRGVWWEKKGVVYFTTDSTAHINEKYTLNFSGTKARLAHRNPRHKSKSLIRTYLQFFASEVEGVKGLRIFKQ